MAPGIPDHEPGHPCLVTDSGRRGRFRAERNRPRRGWEPQISRRRWTKRCLCWGVRQKTSFPSSPMAHPENSDLLTTVVQLLTEQGSDGFAEGIRLLVNEAMVRERSAGDD